MSKLSLPKREPTPEYKVTDVAPTAPALGASQTRKEVVLALLPVASRNSLLQPQSIVEIATHLCEYINTGRKQDTPPDKDGPA